MTNATRTVSSLQLTPASRLPVWLDQLMAVLADGPLAPIAPRGWTAAPEPVYVSADEEGHLWIAPEMFAAL